MKIRQGEPADIPAIAEVWAHSFPGERTLAERRHALETGGPHGGIETVLLGETDGRIDAACRLTPFRQVVAGAALPMLGLAAVAVAPHARRRGLASALCRAALEEGARRGDVVSALYPFRPDFYHRLGWGLAGVLEAHRFRPEWLGDAPDPRVELARDADHAALRECYARIALDSNGLLLRDETIWQRHFETPATHAFIAGDGGGAVSGYLLAKYGTGRNAEKRPLRVLELLARDDATYGRLLAWISRQRDHWRRVRYDAAPDEAFALRLSDPRTPGGASWRRLWAGSARLIRGPMLRLLDVRAAFGARPHWGPARPIDFQLEVDDPELAANRGPHRFAFDGERVNGTDRPPAATLRLGAPALAQLFAGEIDLRTALRLGLASASGPVDGLHDLFRVRSSFRLLDEF